MRIFLPAGVLALFCLAALLPLAAAPASAAVVQLTFTGITAAVSVSGKFDPFHSYQPFSVVYLFDTSLAPLSVSSDPFRINRSIQGGTLRGIGYPISPSLGATVTIFGQTITIGGAYAGALSTEQLYVDGTTAFSALADDGNGYRVSFLFDGPTGILPSSLTNLSLEPFSFIPPDFPYSSHGMLNLPGQLPIDLTFLTMSNPMFPTTMDLVRIDSPIAPVAPVPLPAALPLFAAGLGMMAFLARRKKTAAALPA
jgi:hypothetical protein